MIGISNLKAIAGDGVSFAIPIDTAKDVIAQLLQPNGRVARPYIGCKTLELNSRSASLGCLLHQAAQGLFSLRPQNCPRTHLWCRRCCCMHRGSHGRW